MGRSRIVSASRSFSGSQVKGMDKHHVEGAGLAFCGGHKRHKPGAAGGRPPGHSQFGIYVVGKKEYVVACGVLLDPFKLCVRGKLRLIVRGDPDICCCGSHLFSVIHVFFKKVTFFYVKGGIVNSFPGHVLPVYFLELFRSPFSLKYGFVFRVPVIIH